MKRILASVMVLVIMLCFASCGKGDDTSLLDSQDITVSSNASSGEESKVTDITSTTSKPAATTSKPAATTSKPAATTSKPAATTSKPAHTHSYSAATCTEPQKCSCGETKGKALGHNFSAATCTSAKKCKTCGVTEGKALGHNYDGKSCTRCGGKNPDYVEHTHSFTSATCTEPGKCSCGETKGSALGHNYDGKSCTRCGGKNPDYVEHTHSFTSATCTEPEKCSCGETKGSALGHDFKDATCMEPKTCVVCGYSYGSTKSHDWEYATCTEPDTCKVCGEVRGEPDGHNYYSDGECADCGEMDPVVLGILDQCSLELPELPETIFYYDYNDKIETEVNVTGITYEFEHYEDGKITLTAKFSGTKTYDRRGAGQSDECKIGWKLYDPDGNVFKAGTFYSPSVAEGESFVNKEETLIYNFEASDPGAYRLDILNVN